MSLKFFAAVIHEPRKKVHFALLAQTEEGYETEYRPVVTVAGKEHWVYDIKTAQFISTDDTDEVKKVLERANIRPTRRGVIFSSEKSKTEEFYSRYDFLHTYKTVVSNDQLT